MQTLKPGITADGFRTAVRDYTEPTVVEELAANSYDADATTFCVLLDNKKTMSLSLIDDGTGFTPDAFAGLATLGYGTKSESSYSVGQRHYLGSYGYGVKSSLNICTDLRVTTFSKGLMQTAHIDWSKLDDVLKDSSKGFDSNSSKVVGKPHGTIIELSLKNPTAKSHLDQFKKTLSNLPNDKNKFNCYVGFLADVETDIPSNKVQLVKKLRDLCKKLEEEGKLEKVDAGQLVDLNNCKETSQKSTIDPNVTAKFFFTGFDGNNVKKLKPGLRGIYVRIHGRLLKQSFTESKYTYNISKWTKFASGLRVELEVNWLRDQINLSREGIRFSNEKLEEDFKKILQSAVGQFIQPHLKRLAGKKQKLNAKRHKQRMVLAAKRVKSATDAVVPGIGKGGFIFRPESDAELAVLLAQPQVMKKALKDYKLIDYNDQAAFDCLLYDEKTLEFVNCELEPKLLSYLEHNDSSDVQLIVTWTKSGWKMGARKKGKPGHLELTQEKNSKPGHYRLLEYASAVSKNPRKSHPVVVLDEILKK